MVDRSAPRNYPRLFRAMNEVLRVLLNGGDEEDALGHSFEDAAKGFNAEKALFLKETDQTPALTGQSYSVLCAPVLDPVRDVVLAVLTKFPLVVLGFVVPQV